MPRTQTRSPVPVDETLIQRGRGTCPVIRSDGRLQWLIWHIELCVQPLWGTVFWLKYSSLIDKTNVERGPTLFPQNQPAQDPKQGPSRTGVKLKLSQSSRGRGTCSSRRIREDMSVCFVLWSCLSFSSSQQDWPRLHHLQDCAFTVVLVVVRQPIRSYRTAELTQPLLVRLRVFNEIKMEPFSCIINHRLAPAQEACVENFPSALGPACLYLFDRTPSFI